MKQLLFLVTITFLNTTQLVGGQNAISKKEKFETNYTATKALIETQRFQFVGNLIFDGKKREKLEPNSNTVGIVKSQISGQIVSFTKDNKAFDMNGKIKKYKVTFNDNEQQIAITFRLKGKAVNLNIKPTGQVLLSYDIKSAGDSVWIGKLVKL